MRFNPLTAIAFAATLMVPLTVAAQEIERRRLPPSEQLEPPPGPGPMMEDDDDDDDDDNAKNPALPRSEQGRGQETGGPARNRLPD